MAGTPPVFDRDYIKEHPDWRGSFHAMRERILNQFRADREACKPIQVNGRWVDSTPLSLHELEEMADRRARQTLERRIRARGDSIETGRGL